MPFGRRLTTGPTEQHLRAKRRTRASAAVQGDCPTLGNGFLVGLQRIPGLVVHREPER
jgi:hypothetical protein